MCKSPGRWDATGGVRSISENTLSDEVDTPSLGMFKTIDIQLCNERWSYIEITMTSSIDEFIDSINDVTSVGVSDGLYKYKSRTTCWIVENSTGTKMIVELIDVSGFSNKYAAYRSELASLYGIVKAVVMLENR